MIEIPPIEAIEAITDIVKARQIIQDQAEMIFRLQNQSAALQEELLSANGGPEYEAEKKKWCTKRGFTIHNDTVFFRR